MSRSQEDICCLYLRVRLCMWQVTELWGFRLRGDFDFIFSEVSCWGVR